MHSTFLNLSNSLGRLHHPLLPLKVRVPNILSPIWALTVLITWHHLGIDFGDHMSAYTANYWRVTWRIKLYWVKNQRNWTCFPAWPHIIWDNSCSVTFVLLLLVLAQLKAKMFGQLNLFHSPILFLACHALGLLIPRNVFILLILICSNLQYLVLVTYIGSAEKKRPVVWQTVVPIIPCILS